MATVVPSEERCIELADCSLAVSPSISAPICSHISLLFWYTLTEPLLLSTPLFLLAPIATVEPSPDKLIEIPELSLLASPSISDPICTQFKLPSQLIKNSGCMICERYFLFPFLFLTTPEFLLISSSLKKTSDPVRDSNWLIKLLFLPIWQDHKTIRLKFNFFSFDLYLFNLDESINSLPILIPSELPWAIKCNSSRGLNFDFKLFIWSIIFDTYFPPVSKVNMLVPIKLFESSLIQLSKLS